MQLQGGGATNVASAQITDDTIVNDDINSAAAIAYSKLNLANSLLSGDMHEAVLKTVEVAISSADILALHTTPKQLIAAPGSGKLIVLESVVWSLTYGTATYANGDHAKVIYAGDTTNLLENIITDSVYIKAVANVVGILTPAPLALATAGINAAVQLTLNTATAYITGDSTAKMFIKYRIITL